MKKILFFLLLLSAAQVGFSQTSAEYIRLNKLGDSLFIQQEYLQAARAFSAAIIANRGTTDPADHYIAAESYSISGEMDSAYFHLQNAVVLGYKDLSYMKNDKFFGKLKTDMRWPAVVEGVTKNKRKAEVNFDRKLVEQLRKIYEADQDARHPIPTLVQQKGLNDPEVLAARAKLRELDSLHILTVSKILDERGWLGADIVSDTGAACILLVVQHMSLPMQEKYIPMMREAVKNGKVKPADLAVTEDRILVRQGKKQTYGSQVLRNGEGKMVVQPIEDEANVDKRRASVGLQPIKEYLRFYGIDYQGVSN